MFEPAVAVARPGQSPCRQQELIWGKKMEAHYITICTIAYCSAKSFSSWSRNFVVISESNPLLSKYCSILLLKIIWTPQPL